MFRFWYPSWLLLYTILVKRGMCFVCPSLHPTRPYGFWSMRGMLVRESYYVLVYNWKPSPWVHSELWFLLNHNKMLTINYLYSNIHPIGKHWTRIPLPPLFRKPSEPITWGSNSKLDMWIIWSNPQMWCSLSNLYETTTTYLPSSLGPGSCPTRKVPNLYETTTTFFVLVNDDPCIVFKINYSINAWFTNCRPLADIFAIKNQNLIGWNVH